MAKFKQYFPGKAKAVQTRVGELINVHIPVQDAIEFLEANQNERGWVTLTIGARKSPDESQTHNVWLNDWKPEESQDGQ